VGVAQRASVLRTSVQLGARLAAAQENVECQIVSVGRGAGVRREAARRVVVRAAVPASVGVTAALAAQAVSVRRERAMQAALRDAVQSEAHSASIHVIRQREFDILSVLFVRETKNYRNLCLLILIC